MREHWGFIEVDQIEADDACAIAANEYRGKYSKVIVASPDKDLLQIPNTWFYNYKKPDLKMFYSNDTIAHRNLFMQLILGDTSDNIQGCKGAGVKTATVAYNDIDKKEVTLLDEAFYMNEARNFYYKWYQDILKTKLIKSLEKTYLAEYKVENNIKRLTGNLKSEALRLFKPDLSEIKSKEEIDELFDEMYNLLKLLDNKKDGKKYNFKLSKPLKNTSVPFEDIIEYEEELIDMDEFVEDINVLKDL